jgi:predicted DNA-binding transcriptional regulator AlpA
MKWLRFKDLVSNGIVSSRMTLLRLIEHEGFPEGVLISPNARAWDQEQVDAWIVRRPTVRKPFRGVRRSRVKPASLPPPGARQIITAK